VLVRLAVSADAPITRSTYATLTFQGVTGLSFVQLDDDGVSSAPPAPGPNGGLPRIPLKGSTLGQLTDRAGELMDKVEKVTDNVNQMLGGDNQAALSAAIKEIGGAAKALNQLAANTDQTIQAQFGPNRTDVPQLVRQATGTLKSLENASAKADATLGELNATAADLRRGMNALTAQDGAIDRLNHGITTFNTTTLPHIQGLTENASLTLRRFDRVLGAIDENPQSLLYGNGPIAPGPGEPGYTPPAAGATAPSP
jgi:phospholipid/cholesterol/gamma-HCH transport system substrate-binding protein